MMSPDHATVIEDQIRAKLDRWIRERKLYEYAIDRQGQHINVCVKKRKDTPFVVIPVTVAP